MKVFIAGARSITTMDSFVTNKLCSIRNKHFDVLVGDCYGIDSVVQSFFAGCSYPKVTVYASNGKARNNVGKWLVKSIYVPSTVRGFDFFRQKDVAMANDADIGFMIWDGESRGTLCNILTLAKRGKTVLVYNPKRQSPIVVRSSYDVEKLIPMCSETSKRECSRFLKSEVTSHTADAEQLSMFS